MEKYQYGRRGLRESAVGKKRRLMKINYVNRGEIVDARKRTCGLVPLKEDSRSNVDGSGANGNKSGNTRDVKQRSPGRQD